MKSTPLMDPYSKDPKAYYCGQCHVVYKTMSEATSCCRCYDCNEVLEHPMRGLFMRCDGCAKKKAQNRLQQSRVSEQDAIAGAEKISVHDYEGPVMPGSDGYLIWGDDSIVEKARELGVPGFWAMTRLQRKLSALDFVEGELEEYHEEAGADIPDEAMGELQAFLDSWWEKNEPESWIETRTLFVVCDDPEQCADTEGGA